MHWKDILRQLAQHRNILHALDAKSATHWKKSVKFKNLDYVLKICHVLSSLRRVFACYVCVCVAVNGSFGSGITFGWFDVHFNNNVDAIQDKYARFHSFRSSKWNDFIMKQVTATTATVCRLNHILLWCNKPLYNIFFRQVFNSILFCSTSHVRWHTSIITFAIAPDACASKLLLLKCWHLSCFNHIFLSLGLIFPVSHQFSPRIA